MATFWNKLNVICFEKQLLYLPGWSEEITRNLIRNTLDPGRDLNPKYLVLATHRKFYIFYFVLYLAPCVDRYI
jgi:hypothetical protein